MLLFWNKWRKNIEEELADPVLEEELADPVLYVENAP